MVKVGLVGLGHLGKIHLKLINEIPEIELVGIYDIDANLTEKLSVEYNCKSFFSFEELLENVDAVDIVSPTNTHFDYILQAAKAQKNVFVEKPLCQTFEQAKKLLSTAEEAEVLVQVGHVERFNPAIKALQDLEMNPMFIETHRLANFNPRGTDVAVVLDLMIHDLDIILNVVKSNVKRVFANGVAVISQSPDIANARIEFENGCVANLTASRVSLKSMRKTRIFQKDAYISLDFLEKKAQVIKLTDAPESPMSMPLEIGSGIENQTKYISIFEPKTNETNAIKEELISFVNSISKKTKAEVDIYDGYRAMEVATKIMEQIEENSILV